MIELTIFVPKIKKIKIIYGYQSEAEVNSDDYAFDQND